MECVKPDLIGKEPTFLDDSEEDENSDEEEEESSIGNIGFEDDDENDAKLGEISWLSSSDVDWWG